MSKKSDFRVLKHPTEIWLHVTPYDSGYVMRFLVLEKRGGGPSGLGPLHPGAVGPHGPVVFSRQVKNLTEEVESLNEDVSKLHRAARAAQDTQQQTLEDLHSEEEKLQALSKATLSLEQRVSEVGSDTAA